MRPLTKHVDTASSPFAILHTMLRVGNLDLSVRFYTDNLGMTLLRIEDYPEGEFTLAFLGYGSEPGSSVLELTHNWHQQTYEQGSGFGHVALAVTDLDATCNRLAAIGVVIVRQPGPMSFSSPQRNSPERIAFIEDPDGYRIELIELDG